MPARFAGRPAHAHNRLIASVTIDPPMRREVAREVMRRLRTGSGPTALLLPLHGIEQWDREGQPLHDPQGLAAFMDEMRALDAGAVQVQALAAHINDDAFAQAALAVLDAWVADGRVPPGRPAT
jgi:uncharacterized protein (UPF0261 family)